MATFVFGTGLRSTGEATPAPAPAPAPVPTPAVAEPSRSEAMLPDQICVVVVNGGEWQWAEMAITEEKIEQLIKVRKYPRSRCTIWTFPTSYSIDEHPRNISILALGLKTSWINRLGNHGFDYIGEIAKAGPARLKAIGFKTHEIQAIRLRMKKLGAVLRLLNPRKDVA